MIKVKHLMDVAEADDGTRIWVEPLGLTKDLCEWCAVQLVLPHVGPPRELWAWFERHPDGYQYFRARYHEYLVQSGARPALLRLTVAARTENVTLLHQGRDPQENSAMALYEFLSELSAYCPPE